MKPVLCLGPVLTISLCLSACVSSEVAREVALMSDATEAASARTIAGLQPRLDAFEATEPERAAEDGDIWKLSPECVQAESVFDYSSLSACTVQKFPDGSAEPRPPTPAQAVVRKFALLEDYSAALSELAAAETEEEIKLAFGNATGSLGDLAEQTGSERVGTIAALLGENSEKVDAVVDAGISALRARLLKRTVASAHPQIVDLTGEIKAQLLQINFDTEYTQAFEDMRQANRAAVEARIAGGAGLAAAYRTLEARHSAFLAVAEGSIYNQLDQLAAAHAGLNARLKQNPSAEELQGYVRALKELKATLEG